MRHLPTSEHRPDRCSAAQANQECRQNIGERINSEPKHQAHIASPDHLRAHRTRSGNSDRDIDRPVSRALDRIMSGNVDPGGIRTGFSGIRRHESCCQETDHGNYQVKGHGNECRNNDVEFRQQIESRENATGHCSGRIDSIEYAPPGNAAWTSLCPTRDCRQRSSHEHRRWQQGDSAEHPTQKHPGHAELSARHVGPYHHGNQKKFDQTEHGNSRLNGAIDCQWTPGLGSILACHSRQQPTAQRQASHERCEKHAKRYGCGTDRQLEQLVPYDFVNQGGTATAGKQQHEDR